MNTGSLPSIPRGAVVELLASARALVAAGWTQQVYARTSGGREVDPLSPRARRFCAVGALIRAEWELTGEGWERAQLNVVYEGTPLFVTALALLTAAVQITIVHPREQSDSQHDRVWARAALQASPRGLLDVANDQGARGKREILAAYDVAARLAAALPEELGSA